jgi:hypothetical protein
MTMSERMRMIQGPAATLRKTFFLPANQPLNRTLRFANWRVLRIWQHELTVKNESRLLRRIRRVLSPESLAPSAHLNWRQFVSVVLRSAGLFFSVPRGILRQGV